MLREIDQGMKFFSGPSGINGASRSFNSHFELLIKTFSHKGGSDGDIERFSTNCPPYHRYQGVFCRTDLEQTPNKIFHRSDPLLFHYPDGLGTNDGDLRFSLQEINIRLFFNPKTECQGKGGRLAALGKV